MTFSFECSYFTKIRKFAVIAFVVLSCTFTYASGLKNAGFEDEGLAVKDVKIETGETGKDNFALVENPPPEQAERLKADIAQRNEKVAGLENKFKSSEKVQNAVSEHWAAQGMTDKAVAAANQAFSDAQTHHNQAGAAEALVNRGLARFMQDHSEAGYKLANADGCQAHAVDPANRAALELCRYTDHYVALGAVTGAVEQKTRELAQRLAALQNPDQAHTPEEWAARCQAHPTQACELTGTAALSRKKGDLASALSYADQALQVDSADPMARSLRGLIREARKDHDGAIIDFTRAIAGGWASDDLYTLRAGAESASARHAAAVADANAAVAINPDDGLAYYYRALSKASLKNEKNAGFSYADIAADFKRAAGLGSFPSAQENARLYQQLAEKEARDAAERPAAVAQKTDGSSAKSSAPPLRLILFGAGALLVAAALLWLFWARGEETSRRAAGEDHGAFARRYEVRERLGQGGMGEVFKAWDKNLEREVAVKMPARSLKDVAGLYQSLISEARMLMDLGSHANIVQFYDAVQDDGRVFLILELVKGKTLDDYAAQKPDGRLAWPEAAAVARQIAAALEHAHKKKVVHRDLKPSNVMIGADGAVKVMDFGIARSLKDGYSKYTGSACGTTLYMAPEQQISGQAGARSDLYALALCLYEWTTGRLPFEGEGQLELKMKGAFVPATKLAVGLSPAHDAFFAKALAPDPAKRFTAVSDFILDLPL